MTNGANLSEMSQQECLDLLASHSVGRVAVVQRGRPLIFPVNYILANRTVAFRTDPGTKLDAATLGPVAFEIDDTDTLYREGWSVVVQGFGQELTDAIDNWSEAVTAHPLEPWAAGAKRHWIGISSPKFSGRRIGPT